MRSHSCILSALLLLCLSSCSGEGEGGSSGSTTPIIRLREKSVAAFDAVFTVDVIYCGSLSWSCTAGDSSTHGTVDGLDESLAGLHVDIRLEDLEPSTAYTLTVVGSDSHGAESAGQSLRFTTTTGPKGLYPWEKRRSVLPQFADMTLVTRGQHNANPPLWTPERFASHVVFVDAEGRQHWFFDSFLCIEGYDGETGRCFSITPDRWSADQAAWERLADYWLAPGGALQALDDAVENAVNAGLGEPPFPRYVIISMPDPIRFEQFGDKESSTTYWGSVGGRVLDFSSTADQITACKWYIDLCRERFAALAPKHIELLGFYVLSEELPLAPSFYTSLGKPTSTPERSSPDDTWNWEYKNWEVIVPAVAEYVHSCREGLYWIPYFLAPGVRVWKELGFDACMMQPNHYWDTDNQHPMTKTVGMLRSSAGLGIELEFEYSLVYDIMKDGRTGPDGDGHMIFTSDDIPALWGRFREYMTAFSENGFYGQRPIALYSGTDALVQLATSEEEADRAKYLELGQYIIDSPLKTK